MEKLEDDFLVGILDFVDPLAVPMMLKEKYVYKTSEFTFEWLMRKNMLRAFLFFRCFLQMFFVGLDGINVSHTV